MGTTQTTQQTGQYEPGSMQAYKGITGALGGTLPGFITNPFGSPQFGLEQQMGTRQAQQLGGTGTSNLLRNITASGLFGGPSSAAGLELLGNQSRANTGLQANLGFLAPYMAALQRQQYAMGLGSQFRPLQTGQTQKESTGGLGTWLPQVAGLALGGLTGGLGGGLGGMFGGGGISPFMSANNFGGMSQMQPWAGGGAGAFGEGGGGMNFGYTPGASAGGGGLFGGGMPPPAPPGP